MASATSWAVRAMPCRPLERHDPGIRWPAPGQVAERDPGRLRRLAGPARPGPPLEPSREHPLELAADRQPGEVELPARAAVLTGEQDHTAAVVHQQPRRRLVAGVGHCRTPTPSPHHPPDLASRRPAGIYRIHIQGTPTARNQPATATTQLAGLAALPAKSARSRAVLAPPAGAGEDRGGVDSEVGDGAEDRLHVRVCHPGRRR